MKELIRKLLRESISASEAYKDSDSIKTVIDNKRNVCFICFVKDELKQIAINNNLKYIKVPKNIHDCYIIYREEGKGQALELLNITNKYDGYLSSQASAKDTRRIGQLLDYHEEEIEDFIKDKNLKEQMIDGQNMNQGTQTACNTMSVATYKEGLQLIINAIGHPNQNPMLWKKIEKPLHNWQQEDISINKEIKNGGMSGDSMVDESNTWWSAIQSTICEQGSHVQ